MPVNIKGKSYVMVNERVKSIRDEDNEYYIDTSIQGISDDQSLVIMKATLSDKDGNVLSSGHAQEDKSDASSMVNSTSHIENCETSAIGRCLGNYGIGIDGSIASAEEVSDAIINQKANEAIAKVLACSEAARRLFDDVLAIKSGLNVAVDTYSMGDAARAWYSLEEVDQRALWLAPSKGGIFETEELRIMKTSEFKESKEN
jgi:hypothetical protein|tara:strand:- start:183 stop:788 length:606 start_codon:yes stop_codon:yes gene_type:complete